MPSYKGANLQNPDLQNARFSWANLSSANLANVNLRNANLWNANLRNANFEGADVADINYSTDSRQKNFRGIRAATCHGNQMFKSFAQDQDLIEQFRDTGHLRPWLFWWWWVFADCGRSFGRWAAWSVLFDVGFAVLFYAMGPDHFLVNAKASLPFGGWSMIYYSVVTFTTLGFGDITPQTVPAAIAVMAEVVTGYVMLGGLISILANKLARRS